MSDTQAFLIAKRQNAINLRDDYKRRVKEIQYDIDMLTTMILEKEENPPNTETEAYEASRQFPWGVGEK